MKFLVMNAVIFIYICTSNLSTPQPNNTHVKNLTESGPHAAVIEGEAVTIKKFPYAVRLHIYQPTGTGIAKCTAQAVHSRLVITAAHCIEYPHSSVVVVAGHENTAPIERNETDQNRLAFYPVTHTFSHPLYTKSGHDHDVAILKTKWSMNHRGHAIVGISYKPITDSISVKIYGWGQIMPKKHNALLYAKEVKARPCRLRPYTTYPYMCLSEKGIASGDSGSGMIYKDKLIGIASFYDGAKGSNPFNPTVESRAYYYTPLSRERYFVEDVIIKNGSNCNFARNALTVTVLIFYFIISNGAV